MENVGQVFFTSPQPLDQPPSIQEETWWEGHESEEENRSMDEKEDDVLEGFLKELDVKGHEMIMKMVAKVEVEVPFEEVFGETLHHFRGKHAPRMLEKIARKMVGERDGGFERRERGVDVDSLLKNERFKVKTMNGIGSGVVKEEGEQ